MSSERQSVLSCVSLVRACQTAGARVACASSPQADLDVTRPRAPPPTPRGFCAEIKCFQPAISVVMEDPTVLEVAVDGYVYSQSHVQYDVISAPSGLQVWPASARRGPRCCRHTGGAKAHLTTTHKPVPPFNRRGRVLAPGAQGCIRSADNGRKRGDEGG